MTFSELLHEKGIDPDQQVLVMRHTPKEADLKRSFQSIAETRPNLFNAYQSTQRSKAKENQLSRARYLASFIGHEPERALFVGMFKVSGSRPLSRKAYWKMKAYQELKSHGMKGFTGDRAAILEFKLEELKEFQDWKGKLIVEWPGSEKAWSRWAKDNTFVVRALLEESRLAKAMPDWTEIIWRYSELGPLPRSWEDRMSQWRGIYFIYDVASKKGYVGSAYGKDNILGRWRNYRRTGHGGNKHLRKCKPENLIFSILEIDSHIRAPNDVIKKEASWKERLHTMYPNGLTLTSAITPSPPASSSPRRRPLVLASIASPSHPQDRAGGRVGGGSVSFLFAISLGVMPWPQPRSMQHARDLHLVFGDQVKYQIRKTAGWQHSDAGFVRKLR